MHEQGIDRWRATGTLKPAAPDGILKAVRVRDSEAFAQAYNGIRSGTGATIP